MPLQVVLGGSHCFVRGSSTEGEFAAGHDIQQAEEIAKEIQRLHKEEEVPYRSIACLFRAFRG